MYLIDSKFASELLRSGQFFLFCVIQKNWAIVLRYFGIFVTKYTKYTRISDFGLLQSWQCFVILVGSKMDNVQRF